MEIPTLEDYRRLEHKFDKAVKAVEILVGSLPKKPWTVQDVADAVGLDKKSLYKPQYRHHLPNYGVSDFETGHARWKPETVAWWFAMPESDRMGRRV